MILVVDNYDSFTWNLVHYLAELGAETRVVRNDDLTAAEAWALPVGCSFRRQMLSMRSSRRSTMSHFEAPTVYRGIPVHLLDDGSCFVILDRKVHAISWPELEKLINEELQS